MNLKKKALTFLICLAVIISITGAIHYYFLNEYLVGDFEELFKFSYKFNIGITLLFTLTIILLSNKLKDQLGFLFMAGGFIKITIFLIWSKFTSQELDKTTLLVFFIPYMVCLIVEIYFVSSILKDVNFNKDN
jgi:hypothetical protein